MASSPSEEGGYHEHQKVGPPRTPKPRPRSVTGVTERVRTGHGNMYITINFDEAGKPLEAFSTLGKAGGCDSAHLEAISRLVSLALRSGIDPKEVIDQLRGITCCPAWDAGTLVRSAPDAIGLGLERQLTSEKQARFAAVAQQLALTIPSESAGSPPENQRCPDCNMLAISQEGYWMCVSCGWDKEQEPV